MKKQLIPIVCLVLIILSAPSISHAGEEKGEIDAQLITAICTVVIALAALFVAVWQTRATRIHNRLSVKPHLGFGRKVDTVNSYVELNIENNGIGPAIIKQFEVHIDGNKIQANGEDIWDNVIDSIGISAVRLGGALPYIGTAMRVGEVYPFFRLDLSSGQSNQAIHDALSKISIIVNYESVYGEKFEARMG